MLRRYPSQRANVATEHRIAMPRLPDACLFAGAAARRRHSWRVIATWDGIAETDQTRRLESADIANTAACLTASWCR